MATYSSALAWKIPWMEEPGRLQSMEKQRIEHNWATSLSFFPCSNCRSLIRCSVCKYFLPFCGLSFHSLGSVLQSTEVIVLIKSCLFFFCCHL